MEVYLFLPHLFHCQKYSTLDLIIDSLKSPFFLRPGRADTFPYRTLSCPTLPHHQDETTF